MSYSLGDKASLSGIRKLIRSDLTAAGVDPSASFDCLVAVTEACTNALLHGRGPDGDEPEPRVGWEVRPNEASFLVEDFSTERWSKASHPSSDLEVDLADHNEGDGLQMIRKLMDEVDVEVSALGTRIKLTKRFLPH